MAFQPGKPKTGGRTVGTKNKATQAAREAIGMFVDNNADRLQAWLDKVAEDNPQKAFELFQSVIEYHVPKLNRTTVGGDPDAPIGISVNVGFVANKHKETPENNAG
jgi:hypothetical protein